MESATPHHGGRFSVLTIFLATKRNLSGTGLRLYLCARSGLLTYNPKLAGERMNEVNEVSQASDVERAVMRCTFVHDNRA